MAEKGVTLYLTATEVRALNDAGGYLSSLLEATSTPSPDLSSAHEGLHNIAAKAQKARESHKRRTVLSKALKLADEILAQD